MYGLGELKAKTIRSWARAFGEELEEGGNYIGQPPTIAIAFANGQIEPIEKAKNADANKNKIHRFCMIMDCEDFTVFTDLMELHYIDMKAYAKAVNEKGSINIADTEEVMFAKWLSIITQKEITNKAIIKDAFKDEEEIQLAVSTLVRHGEDKITRQAYQRRKDEIYFYNKEKHEYNRLLEEKDIALAEKDAIIAELRSRLGEK